MTMAIGSSRAVAKPLAPDYFERILAGAALLLHVAVVAALARGVAEWGLVWVHVVTICLALMLTPVMLLRRRGDRAHRMLGTIWVAAMFGAALLSIGIREINDGSFSLIHILSIWVIVQAPLIWWQARTHNVRAHRATVRGMVTGALLVAGFFTFPFDRLLGHWLFG